MAHIYRLYLDSRYSDTIGNIVTFLTENGLIRGASNMQPGSVEVTVGNKRKFLHYLRKKDREPTDPGCNIKIVESLGQKGRAAPSSREGRLMHQRIKKFKDAKKKQKLFNIFNNHFLPKVVVFFSFTV